MGKKRLPAPGFRYLASGFFCFRKTLLYACSLFRYWRIAARKSTLFFLSFSLSDRLAKTLQSGSREPEAEGREQQARHEQRGTLLQIANDAFLQKFTLLHKTKG